MSNALLVGADHTTTGHPLTVFGPQTGYYAPQLLTEIVLTGPGVNARGVSFAGTQLVVAARPRRRLRLVGDQREQRQRRHRRRAAVQRRRHARHRQLEDATCVGRRVRADGPHVHKETALPNPAPRAAAAPAVRGAAHPARHRAAAHDRRRQPVAIVIPAQHLPPRGRLGRRVRPAQRPGVRSTTRRRSSRPSTRSTTRSTGSTPTDRDIAYYTSGRLPLRAAGIDFDLPRWGDSALRLAGLAALRRARAPDQPAAGYLVSWNNKPAPGFAAADNVWGYGSVYRSLALSRPGRRGHRAAARWRAPSWSAWSADAATVDSRARYTLPDAARRDRRRPKTAAGRSLLAAWLADGAHRVDRDRDGPTRTRPRSRCSTSGGSDGDEAGRLGPCVHGREPRAISPTSCRSRSTTTRASAGARPGTASPGTATSTRTCAS